MTGRNIQELRNLIERLMIMTHSPVITPEDIRLIKGAGQVVDYFSYKTLKEARDAFEKDFIAGNKLEANQWNISKTAGALSVERSNLHRKIKSYGINQGTKTPANNYQQSHNRQHLILSCPGSF